MPPRFTLAATRTLLMCGLLAGVASVDGRADDVTPLSVVSVDRLSGNIQGLADQLADDSFQVRRQAYERLIAMSENPATALAAKAGLRKAASHRLLEIRVSANRAIDEIEDRRIDRQLSSLLLPTTPAEAIELPGWQHYRVMAGDDHQARQLFAEMTRQHYEWMKWLSDRHAPQGARICRGSAKRTCVNTRLAMTLDPYNMSKDDAVLWALLFCVDSPDVQHGLPNLSMRLSAALSHGGVGPKLEACRHASTLRRMISSWVASQRRDGFSRERLMIAVRYDCHDRVAEVCQQVFDDPVASPSEEVMAMLCASIIRRQDLEQVLLRRIDDERTAHVWQLLASRKKKIRTQVRDVAMALMLRQAGIDPRTVGFNDLQADPLVVYRERSLGFADETARRDAYRRAAIALGEKQ